MGIRATIGTTLLLLLVGLTGCRRPTPDPDAPEPAEPVVPEATTSGGQVADGEVAP